ncbi:MAG: dihydropteroate synthase [Gemmatimonadota bacterium]|nr:MAG: dihydropteroate synthase [Gemmatimonadota bacterium]
MGRGVLSLEQPAVVGILNVTPDSFSDGGRFLDAAAALEQAARLVAAGAHMLDVGAESTRPGRPEPVSVEEEWRRLEPVLHELTVRHPAVPVSVDTVKAETAARALAAGAWAVNDVSGLRLDPEVADVCAEHGAGLVLMHSRGSVSEMAGYEHATYDAVVDDVIRELEAAVEVALGRGVARERIVLDPGLGFSKRPEQNYAVLRGLPSLVALGRPVMVGPSRKRFLGAVTGGDVGERDAATATACAAACLGGASLFRVHAVQPVRDALAIAHAIRSA